MISAYRTNNAPRVIQLCALLLPTLVVAPTAMAAGRGIEQRLRTVDVAEQTGDVYTLEVLAAPKLTTTIRLPEGFVAADVLCGGACIDASELGNKGGEAANWVIEKRTNQQSIHVWPARLPGPGNPTSAFATNIYIATDEGKAYNVELRLLDLADKQRSADAVVNVVNSKQKSKSARQHALQEQCREQAREQLQQEVRTSFLATLNGKVSCRAIRWSRPHRAGLLLVRLAQACRTLSKQPMLWVTYSIENRSDGPLQIDSVRLEPSSNSFQGESEDASALSAQVVLGKQIIYGVAARTFKQPTDALRDWRLEVVPEPTLSAGSVVVSGINF